MSKQIKITNEFFKCCMPDLEQSSKIFFHQEVKLVSPQRSKSIFRNKNRFSTPTQLSFTLVFQIKLVCPTVSMSSQHRIFLDLLQQEVSNFDRVCVWLIWSGRGPAQPAGPHGLLSLSRSSLCALKKKPQTSRSFQATQCWQCKETPIYFSHTHPPIKQHYKFPSSCSWECQQNQKSVHLINQTKKFPGNSSVRFCLPFPLEKIWKSAKAQIRLPAAPSTLNFKKTVKANNEKQLKSSSQTNQAPPPQFQILISFPFLEPPILGALSSPLSVQMEELNICS